MRKAAKSGGEVRGWGKLDFLRDCGYWVAMLPVPPQVVCADGRDVCRLFVGGLSAEVTAVDLTRRLNKLPGVNVLHVDVPTSPLGGQCSELPARGCGLVFVAVCVCVSGYVCLALCVRLCVSVVFCCRLSSR